MTRRKPSNVRFFSAVVCMVIPLLYVSRFSAQPSPAPLSFEVASVRPHKGSNFRTGPLTVSGPLIRMEGYTVFGLVMDAYHVRDFQLVFGNVARPDDIYDTMYDIVARSPGEGTPSIEQVRAMLQSLLADRFQLKVHHETKEMPVYALVAGKTGIPFEASSPDEPCSVHQQLARDGRNDEETFTGCPMERLADRLGNMIGGRPVLDKTGLTGKYNFQLIAIPEYKSRKRSEGADISPMTAVGKLGLKLSPEKAQIEVIVVDHLVKPTEN